MVEAWKKVDDLVKSGDEAFKQLKIDPDFLKKFDEVVKNDALNKHVFDGEVKPRIDKNTGLQKVAPDGTLEWNVTGAHSVDALDPNKLRIKGPTTPQSPGVDDFYSGRIEAKVETFTGQPYSPNNGWKVKDKPSTFFPKSWTKDKIQAEIANAFKNKVAKGGNKYEGFTTGGQKIVMYFDETGVLKSAFPEL